MFHVIVNVNLIKENITQCKSRITENVDVSVKVCSNQVYEKKNYAWNPTACAYKKDEYLGGIIDHSVVTCDLKKLYL